MIFLEETFCAASAPPEHRYHQKAAREVLKALLPESGSEIKGHMRSHAELLEASGYANRPKDFDELIRMLDSEIRLIAPTDPEGKGGEESASQVQPGQKYYQLTHDYLVPLLTDWLTRKQKEARRGRAELLLADRATVWNGRPENQQLPSLWQWLSICWLTPKKKWTPPQQRMMRQAGRYHTVRGVVALVLLALIGWGSYEGHGALRAHTLTERLLVAKIDNVPAVVADMASYRRWLNPFLEQARQEADANSDRRKQLRVSLALEPVDSGQVAYLYGRLLDAEPDEVPVICNALKRHKNDLLKKLWAVVETPAKGKERLRAGAALAQYDPASDRWANIQEAVANDMVVSAVNLPVWLEAFRPVKEQLLTPLSAIFREAGRPDAPNPVRQRQGDRERFLATEILVDYAAKEPQVLADLLMDADEKQFAVIFPKFEGHGAMGLSALTGAIDQKLPPDANQDAKEKLAKRQANAAVALLKMSQPEKVWPLLKHSHDPRVRSYLIHRFGPLGANANAIAKRLDEEPDFSIRRALILSLGEYGEKDLSPDDRKAVLAKLQEIYTEADPGLHAATEWLLRTWKQDDWLKKVNDDWAEDHKQRDKKVEGIKQTLAKEKDKTSPQWYVNGQGQTMVVIPDPVDFMMGSPPLEAGRDENDEGQHKKHIGRTFAVAAKLVTVEQYKKFDKGYKAPPRIARDNVVGLPVVANWFDAAAYCNWLSEQEGKQTCYETEPAGKTGPARIVMKANYLRLDGYRLPTEAEMEYVTRAGALTSRHFGETEELLPKYACCQKNSKEITSPVGSLKPNDFGLFDVHGNVYAWCQESFQEYKGKGDNAVEDEEDKETPTDTLKRVLRGGSFKSPLSQVRSANRVSYLPTGIFVNPGFRVARTVVPAKKFTNSLGMEFVLVPRGKSWLGGGNGKEGTEKIFDQDFYLGTYEVTQEEWQKVMDNNPSCFSPRGKFADAVKDIADSDLKRFPVENVSWKEATEFVKRVNEKVKKDANEAGWEYRLPKEREWEYACRGGPMSDKAESAFNFYFETPTKTLSKEQANFVGSDFKRPCKVGSYPANRLGLYDMHGNVSEWCQDLADGEGRSLRGGNWLYKDKECRAASRLHLKPSVHDGGLGFRLARVPLVPGPAKKFTNSHQN